VDAEVARKIVAAAQIHKDDMVLEIGAGLGALTELLAQSAGRVLAVEIDRHLCRFLNEGIASKYRNVEIICEDILKMDLRGIVSERHKGKVKVVSNLPYAITSPVIIYLLSCRELIESMLMTVQDEVATRILAKPGTKEYGALSCLVQFHTVPSTVLGVSRHAFLPVPMVDSCVVRMDVRLSPAVEVIDEDLFFRIVRSSFQQRRKTLLNSLSTVVEVRKDRSLINGILREVGIESQRRGETLSLEEFAKIANALALYILTLKSG
jgi:16S rRNA (adenine1518-N6/adenine1519-N6)-dimethyltransferase